MLVFIILACLFENDFIIEAHYTSTPPVIDGRIEKIWENGDSAKVFTQITPQEGEPASEPTTVYLLYDNAYLYVAYKCETPGRKPVARFSGTEDEIRLYLDTFDNKTTCYVFSVSASGWEWDGIVLDDGRNTDWSWEGVWFSKTKVYPKSYIVELKIPFKSIRYKKGLTTWGINFRRYIYKGKELVYWAKMNEKDGLRLSRFGKLIGIKPEIRGHSLEIYPVAFLRRERYEKVSTYPSFGLNLSWGVTPEISIISTVNPDFGEVESDPYTLNLSKYETYFNEGRPFFVEGSEHFRVSSFGENEGCYSPIEPFYSRRIGKRLESGEEVPISFGTKLIGIAKRWDSGGLFARTEEKGNEQAANFSCLRYEHGVFENSSLGFLFSDKETRNDYSRAFDLDGALRTQSSQLLYQSVLSDRDGKRGLALSTGLKGMHKGFIFMGGGQILSDSFDIDEIGYAKAIPGERQIIFAGGPIKFYKRGLLRSNCYGAGIGIGKSSDEQKWSYGGVLFLNPNFRNDWGFSFNTNIGKTYEADTQYISNSINLSVWSGGGGNWQTNFGFWYGYQWNWDRDWLAYQGSNWFWASYTLTDKISVSVALNSWVEFKPVGVIHELSLQAITSRITPRLEFNITRNMSFSIYSEFVPVTESKKTELDSRRLGFLYSWKIAPKSFIYIAFNDYSERNENRFSETERISIGKLKWLLYF